jgi:epoxyqueuosine reductase
MTKILFHICCGPCATASLERLQKEGYQVVGFYYNPNIHPEDEYKKRLLEAKRLAKELGIKLIVPKYDQKEYFEAIGKNRSDKSQRCPKCWELRLSKTAQKARELGIKNFGTTLRISPYQNQKDLLLAAKEIAQKEGLRFYEPELTSCFQESIELSKAKDMYRQKYCGCIFSKDYN